MMIHHNNSNSSSTSPVLSHNFVVTWFITTSSILAIGSISSILLIISISIRKRYRTTTNLLVIHVLLFEAVNMALLTPVSNTAILTQQTGRPFAGNCIPVAFGQMLLTVLSNWSLTFLAINRAFAVVLPHRYQSLTNRRSLLCVVATTWTFSLCTTVPLFFGVGASLHRLYPLGHCGVQPTRDGMFTVFTHISFTCPLVTQAICYGLVVLSLKHAVQIADMKSFAEQRKQRRQRAISVVLLVVYLWYLICYLPIPVITTYFYWYWKHDYGLFVWLRTLLICGSAGTPVILLSMSREHRLALRGFLARTGECLLSNRMLQPFVSRARVNTLPTTLHMHKYKSRSSSLSRPKVYVYT